MSIKLPSFYETELNLLYNMFEMSLEEISKSYVNYKLGVNTAQYKEDTSALQSVKSDIFLIKNNLSTDSLNINNQLGDLNEKLTALNIENVKLTSKLNSFDNQGLAAEGELTSQKVLYDELYTQNIVFIIVIIVNIGLYIMKNYKSS